MKSFIETKVEEIKNNSEVINDSLWYVNPKDIEKTLLDTLTKAKDIIEKKLKQVSGEKKIYAGLPNTQVFLDGYKHALMDAQASLDELLINKEI